MNKVLIALAFLLVAFPCQAATQKSAKKHGKKQENCQPIDVNSTSTHCYKLRPGGGHGRCEPQSLPYARCRTGNMCCRGNHELSPIGWYHGEERLGHVSPTPAGGSVLILGDNSRHKMNTGHVFYVESVRHKGGEHWELTLSHTNYDRQCHIETNVLGEYNVHTRNLAMKTGHWSVWGKDLHALGFIVK